MVGIVATFFACYRAGMLDCGDLLWTAQRYPPLEKAVEKALFSVSVLELPKPLSTRVII